MPLNWSILRNVCSVNSVVILIQVQSKGKYKGDKWVRVKFGLMCALLALRRRTKKPCLYFCIDIFNYSISKALLLTWCRNNCDLKLSENVIFSNFIENNKCEVIIKFNRFYA